MSNEYDDLLNTMNNLNGETRKKALSKSLRAMGNLMEAAIKVRAPFQAGEQSHGDLAPGELAANITTRVHISKDENAASDEDYVTIGPNSKVAYIANMVENGHDNRKRTKKSNKPRSERTQAHPFVRPAFDATKDEAIEVFEQTMTEEIRKAFDA